MEKGKQYLKREVLSITKHCAVVTASNVLSYLHKLDVMFYWF